MSRLTRDGIVQTALRLLEETGLDGLTTRRLADALGVKSPALYWHFASRRDLLDAVADAMLAPETWTEPDPSGADPASWLTDRARSLRRELLAHRDGALIHAGTRPADAELPAVERQVGALVAAGLSPADAARTVLALSRYVVGWVLEEQAVAARGGEGASFAAVAAGPILAAAREVVEQRDPDADFEFGLRGLVAGLLAQANRLE